MQKKSSQAKGHTGSTCARDLSDHEDADHQPSEAENLARWSQAKGDTGSFIDLSNQEDVDHHPSEAENLARSSQAKGDTGSSTDLSDQEDTDHKPSEAENSYSDSSIVIPIMCVINYACEFEWCIKSNCIKYEN